MLANHPNMLGRGPTASSLGIGDVDGPSSATDNALARFDGTTGKIIQNGVVTEADYTGTLTGATDQSTTTAVGLGFTNQPANDGVEIVSSSASDTQTATVIGTTNGVDTVVVEAVVLTGTSVVSTVKTDWGIILAVKLSSAAVGTITVREASADQTITTLAPAATSKGVTTVTNTAAYNRTISMVADAATTKQLGFGGTDTSGTQIYDSQALTGTTAAVTNSSFYTVTEIYRGDLEVARTATITTNGGWNLTGGGGGNLSFDTFGGITLTAAGTNQNITLTPSGTGEVATSKNFNAAGQTQYGLNSVLLSTAGTANYVVLREGVSTGYKTAFGHDSAGNFLVYNQAANSNFSSADITAKFTTTHNLLLGGLTTDGTGVLQFPAATTSAGGITMGVDVNLFRSASATLSLTGALITSGSITVPGGSVAALVSAAAWTSGAGAQVGTLTNAPAAGNPTSWIKVVDNGVTRYVPAW